MSKLNKGDWTTSRKLMLTIVGVLSLGLVFSPISSLYAKGDDDEDDSSDLTFTLDDGFAADDNEIELLTELYPDGASVYFTGKKLKTEKALSVKVKKVDGEYELVLKDSDSSSNYAGLKLSYSRKKGTVKGSFKVYGIKEYESKSGKTKMKLVKYSVKVKGSFDGESGDGEAYSKKLGTSNFSLN